MNATNTAIAEVFDTDKGASSASDRRPLPPRLSVLQARDAYLAENGFDTAGYTAGTFDVEAFGRTYTFTNTADRKWAIPLHDLHHAATGYGTDLVGEAEVGAFELMGGCRTAIVYALNISAVVMGLFVAPVRTLRAFVDSRRARALFRQQDPYGRLLEMPLGDLRDKLGIPREGLAREARRLHDEREVRRSDAMPGAPRQPLWVAAVGAVQGLATLGVASFELVRGRSLEGALLDGAACWLGFATAALGALLAASAPAVRRGSLGGRALFGHAAFGLVVVNVVAAVAFAMAPALAASTSILPLLLLWALARRTSADQVSSSCAGAGRSETKSASSAAPAGRRSWCPSTSSSEVPHPPHVQRP
ncbi:MAG TPA: hypothetical protein VM580_00640 [Labilithrix sp.]|nr:hypothetical protein [Labilithrix sp.]